MGEAALGKRVGRKAALWGAICGTLPDLDVVVPFADPVATFTYHRSFSHSLFVLAALTPLIVWLIRKVHPQHRDERGWYALVYLSFATHVLLDSLTIYGTQIFWPVVTTPVSIGSVFIIDPLYTVPLIIGLVAVFLARRRPAIGRRVLAAGLTFSAAYLAWGFAAQSWVHNVAKASLERQGLATTRQVTLAAPFTTLMWRIVAMHDDGYRVGWYSLVEGGDKIIFADYPSETALLDAMPDHWPVNRLRWFTKGFFGVSVDGADVLMTDLRMGVEGSYVFSFKVAEIANPHPIPVASTMVSDRPDFDRVDELWDLLLHANSRPNRRPL